MNNSGWFNESRRHALASQGIKTGTRVPAPMPLPEKKGATYMDAMNWLKALDERDDMIMDEGITGSAMARALNIPVSQARFFVRNYIESKGKNIGVVFTQDKDKPEVQPTFDSSKYEYDTGDQYETRGYDWTGRYIIGNKTLQENLMGQPIILRRDTNTDEEWGLFDGAGYDRSKKKYYIAYKRQDKPSGALTGEIKGKFFLNSRYDDSIKGIKIRGKRLR